tara:strand:+ start:1116 stop:1331 length:216 start_codon:yes stop_codon:yes gene_type:complete
MTKKKSFTSIPEEPKKVVKESVERVIVKPKLVKKKYTLITDININNIIYKKGSIFELTKEGAQYFKQQFYI